MCFSPTTKAAKAERWRHIRLPRLPFSGRPYTSRLGAWASEQSSVIAGKSIIVARAAAEAVKHPLHVPRPPHWGGYLLIPDRVEFWQGRPSRLHDRIQYRLEGDKWIKERLAP